MLAATVALASSWLGIVPTKINALGVELSSTERSAILKGAFSSACTFLVAFVVYAVLPAYSSSPGFPLMWRT